MQYYRYVNVYYAEETVELRAFDVISETDKTVLLRDPYYIHATHPGERRVLKGDGHRYAHSTREAALDDFIARKKCQLVILRHQQSRVSDALELGEAMRGTWPLSTNRMSYAEIAGPTSLMFSFELAETPPA